MDAEDCQGITTDKVKAAIQNINPTKAAGPDKIYPWLLHHLGPVSNSLLISISNNKMGGDQSPRRMEISRHQINPERRDGPTEDEEL